MTDFIVVIILVAVIAAAIRYIYKEKKRGAKCIGCAAGKNGCGCSCGNSGAFAANGTDPCRGCSRHKL